MNNDNKGACGHVRCAGGSGCLQVGAPMNVHGYQKMKEYKLAFVDATIIDQDERDHRDTLLERLVTERFTNKIWPGDVEIINDGDGDWVDFATCIRFMSAPEDVFDDVQKVLARENRTIETWTLFDGNGERVLTEEDLND